MTQGLGILEFSPELKFPRNSRILCDEILWSSRGMTQSLGNS
nr:hypothetical protein [uncultured Campylobacter sp.]